MFALWSLLYVHIMSSLSTDAESELMRMERVYSDTSQRISELQQQLSAHRPNCSDDDNE